MITIHGNSKTVRLPWSLSWAYSNPRQQATKISLSGNEIQQYSVKSTSAGTFSYSADADTADAATLDAMQYATGEATVSDGSHAWLATLDVQLKPSAAPGKTNVTISMRTVRRLV